METGPLAASVPSLFDLVEARRWQRLQDHFADVLGVSIRTVDRSGALLAAPSWPPSVPVAQAVELLKVGEELEQLVPAEDPPREAVSHATPFGVTYAAVPIRITPEQPIAYFVVGPLVVGPREDKLQFRERLSALGLDPLPAWNFLLSLKPYTFSGIRSLLGLLEEVGASLTQFAYQARRLAELLPESGAADRAVVTYYTDRVISALLEVAAMATRAEGGSVMLADSEEGPLTIRAALGLSDAVVAGTRQRREEGIAGLVAAERAIRVVDDFTTDARLQPLMRRKDLVSSLVAPIVLEPGRQPLGVLSLRTTDRERRFTPQHVEMVQRLLDLAGIALSSLRPAFSPKSTAA
jgi:GAF domain-containing protein